MVGVICPPDSNGGALFLLLFFLQAKAPLHQLIHNGLEKILKDQFLCGVTFTRGFPEDFQGGCRGLQGFSRRFLGNFQRISSGFLGDFQEIFFFQFEKSDFFSAKYNESRNLLEPKV